MPGGFVRRRRTGSCYGTSGQRSCLDGSGCVCRGLGALSLGLSLLDGRAAVEQRDLCLTEQLDHRSDIKPVRARRREPRTQDSRSRRWRASVRDATRRPRSGLFAPLDAAQHPDRVLEPPLRDPRPRLTRRPDPNSHQHRLRTPNCKHPLNTASRSACFARAAVQQPGRSGTAHRPELVDLSTVRG
jgi:hypothetical protein